MSGSTVATTYIESVGGRQQRALVLYFVLVLVGVGVAALLVARLPGLLPTTLVLLLASWIPNVVGVLVTARTDGRAGLSQLFARIVRWRFSWAWYAAALLLPVAAVLLAIGGGALFGVAPPRIITDPGVFLPLLLINVLAGPLGEELGWRGTALPRLLTRWGALSASLMLGVAWWTFHTPGFLLGLFSPGFHPFELAGGRDRAHCPDHLDVQQHGRQSHPRIADASVDQLRHRCDGGLGIADAVRGDRGHPLDHRGNRRTYVRTHSPGEGRHWCSKGYAVSARNRSTAVTRRSTAGF